MGFTKTGLILSVLLMLAFLNASVRERQLQVSEAYTYKRAGDWDFVFVPEGGQFLVWRESEPKFTLVDWRDGTSRTFEITGVGGASLRVNKRRRIIWVNFVPNTRFVFVTLDDELLRLDRDGWRSVESYGRAYVDVSRDGSIVLVSRPELNGKAARVEVVETTKWATVRSIAVPDRGAFLTPDNKYIAVGQFVWREDMKRCLMSLFEIETGKLARVTDFLKGSQDCPGYASFFHPTHPNTMISDRFGKKVIFWDIGSGLIVRTIEEPFRLEKPAVSPDGRWLYGSVRERDPQVLRDFKIWDIKASKVAFESPLYRNRAKTRSDNDPVTGLFSPDSKHLAVRTAGRLMLYRLYPK